MPMLTADDILAHNDLKVEKVEVPEWGGEVYVREMTAGARDRFERAHVQADKADFRARLAVATICDENGRPLFNSTQLQALAGKSGNALTRIFLAASRLNGMTTEEVDQAEGES